MIINTHKRDLLISSKKIISKLLIIKTNNNNMKLFVSKLRVNKDYRRLGKNKN